MYSSSVESFLLQCLQPKQGHLDECLGGKGRRGQGKPAQVLQ